MSDHYVCRHCHKGFMSNAKTAPPTCGMSPCWEQEYWTDEDWSCRRDLAMKRDENTPTIVRLPPDENGNPMFTIGPAGPNQLDLLALAREPDGRNHAT